MNSMVCVWCERLANGTAIVFGGKLWACNYDNLRGFSVQMHYLSCNYGGNRGMWMWVWYLRV